MPWVIRYIRAYFREDCAAELFHLSIFVGVVSGCVHVMHVKGPANVLEKLCRKLFSAVCDQIVGRLIMDYPIIKLVFGYVCGGYCLCQNSSYQLCKTVNNKIK